MYCDNKAAIEVAMSEESKTFKHMVRLCYHYIRYEVSKINIVLKWISTNDQIADIFTKVLGKEKFEIFRSKLINILD